MGGTPQGDGKDLQLVQVVKNLVGSDTRVQQVRLLPFVFVNRQRVTSTSRTLSLLRKKVKLLNSSSNFSICRFVNVFVSG